MIFLLPVLHGAPNSPLAIVENVFGILALFFLCILLFSDRRKRPDEPPNLPDPDEDAYLPPASSLN
jgi:hypothetical protein